MGNSPLVSALADLNEWTDWQARLGERAGFKCEYCDRNLLESIESYDSWEVDHILPTSKDETFGGERSAEWNLALSCTLCNKMKRAWPLPGGLDPRTDRAACIAAIREMLAPRRNEKRRKLSTVWDVVQRYGA